MFNADLIRNYPNGERQILRDALIIVAESGLIQLQRDQLFAQAVELADHEDEATVAKKIQKYRQDIRNLVALQELGEQLKTERENAQDDDA